MLFSGPAAANGAERFQVLIDAVVDYAIYMLDPQGYIVSWNPGAERIKGYAPDEIIGQHFSRFFTPEDQAAGRSALALDTAQRTGRFEDENWRVRKDGSRFWALAVLDAIRAPDGTLIGFAKITRDMTDRKRVQDELRRSEERFRLLVEGVVDYAIFMLDRDGRIASWNAGARRIKGYATEQISGQHFSRFYTAEDQGAGVPQRILARALREGRCEMEGPRVRKDGSTFWAHVVIDAIRDDAGTLIGFAKVTRDLTERKQAQEALDKAKEQLFQAQKMETVGQLTGGVAHDFNNLLTAVLGSLDLITHLTSDERVRRLVDTAQRATNRGAQLTAQLLAFSRRQTLNPQTANLNDLIDAFDTLLRRAAGDSVAFERQFDPRSRNVEVDTAQFQAAILNLVVNAQDAMAQGGTLTIRTANVELGPERADTFHELTPGPYVMVEVSDSGTGMSDEVRARAIEPFFTTKDVGEGSGLGLSQVYGFVRQSGGQLEIVSTPGTGTAVRLYLPRSASDSVADESRPSVAPVVRTGRILVVEDDAEVRHIAVQTLELLGYTTFQAHDAPEAMAMLQAGLDVDVLFTDVVMPKGMSGVVLAKEARRIRPDLRILLASGHPRETLDRVELIPGDFAFIGKPYQVPGLTAALEALL
ncbi:hybrid sensor histidine kinase/response regulator [Azospirillum canadense]|uniref:hybrid sensor histidine kinase/response regulator n=1 Tax=Azospirillum canadense TaxID=403962 RepID=UPI002227997A|nr:PAS domain-containing sensor histidine kinase [Azospirillum canadense]MCW2241474.1 PAS domain S-box-containing protein [Azospirillum canadense]